MAKYYLGLDQGTSGVTAILFDENWRQASRGYREIRQIYPQAGWVEHDATDIWHSACAATQQAMDQVGAAGSDILCIGLDHEGESVMLWDKQSGQPLFNAIVWQDRRHKARAYRPRHSGIHRLSGQRPAASHEERLRCGHRGHAL